MCVTTEVRMLGCVEKPKFIAWHVILCNKVHVLGFPLSPMDD